MSPRDNLQEAIFAKVLPRFEKKAEAVEALVQLLGVSRDGIYRRLRGDTALSPREISILARQFKLSVDQLISEDSNHIIFDYNLFSGPPVRNFFEYLQQVKHQVTTIGSLPGLRIYYASHTIPLFYYMLFPELLSFKLYVYGLTNWHFDYLQKTKFCFDLITPEEKAIGYEVGAMYSKLDSTDLWTMVLADDTLNQIEYMAMEGRFEREEEALIVCRQVGELVNHARAMAEAGRKFVPGSRPNDENGEFNLYYNELSSSSNIILGRSDHGQVLFITFTTPNFLLTFDERLCRRTEEWFSLLINRSASISFHSAQSRNFYFNRIEKKVEQTLRKLEMFFGGL